MENDDVINELESVVRGLAAFKKDLEHLRGDVALSLREADELLQKLRNGVPKYDWDGGKRDG
tara:strand:- start:3689 stop:3874 length:186 start_codon:yes stop_codon:yes gene_type:complete